MAFGGFEIAGNRSMGDRLFFAERVRSGIPSAIEDTAAKDQSMGADVRTGFAAVITTVAVTTVAVAMAISNKRHAGNDSRNQTTNENYRDSIRPHQAHYTTISIHCTGVRVQWSAARRVVPGGYGRPTASVRLSLDEGLADVMIFVDGQLPA